MNPNRNLNCSLKVSSKYFFFRAVVLGQFQLQKINLEILSQQRNNNQYYCSALQIFFLIITFFFSSLGGGRVDVVVCAYTYKWKEWIYIVIEQWLTIPYFL